jgi:glycosyltransferase involved in cell wall biosynthesis
VLKPNSKRAVDEQSAKNHMKSVSIVYNGICAKDGTVYYHMRSFVEFLHDLIRLFPGVRYYGGYLEPDDTGHHFAFESPLALPGLELTLVKGNSTNTGNLAFIRNNMLGFLQMVGFVRRSEHIMVFLPSFLSVFAGVLALVFRKDLGVYIGGGWREPSKHQKMNLARALAYPVNRFLIDPMVFWVSSKARFIFTPGYDLYHKFKSLNYNVILPVPLINLSRDDVLFRTDTCQGREKRILYVGALRYAKGILILLEAFARLKHNHTIGSETKLWIVGSGESESDIKEKARELQISQDIELFGHIPNGSQLYEFYRQSDVFVLPSFSEGFPRVLYEAMTFSVPMIATEVGGIPHFLHHLFDAYLVPPGSVDRLEEAITTVLSDAQLRTRMIENARDLMLDVIFKRQETETNLAHQVQQQFDPFSPVTDCHEQ